MKRLFYIALALVLITTIGCKRKDRAERLYERYLNDSNRVEFVIPSADTIAVEEEVEVPGDERHREPAGEDADRGAERAGRREERRPGDGQRVPAQRAPEGERPGAKQGKAAAVVHAREFYHPEPAPAIPPYALLLVREPGSRAAQSAND